MAKQIKELEKTYPVIYAADFNTNPCTEAFKVFEENCVKGKATDGTFKSAYEYDTTCPENKKDSKGQELPVPDVFSNTTKPTTFKSRKGGNQIGKCQKIAQAIDFIFYSEKVTCTKTLSLPELNMDGSGLPNWQYPSDHLMIAGEFELEIVVP